MDQSRQRPSVTPDALRRLNALFTPALCRLSDQFAAAGHQLLPVGGAVRDALLGRDTADLDLATSASPAEMLQLLPVRRLLLTGLKHGSVTLLSEDGDGALADITTYRMDMDYSDGRHPDRIARTDSLVADLARRDFTVNAMAYTPETGLIDPFRGLDDLNARLLRTVGDPVTRFREDALRLLRALRFASELDFRLEPDTEHALLSCRQGLTRPSGERITAELDRLLVGPAALRILQSYRSVLEIAAPGLLPALVPDAFAAVPADPDLRLAALLVLAFPDPIKDDHPSALQTRLDVRHDALFRRLRLTRRRRRRLTALAAAALADPAPGRRGASALLALLKTGAETTDDLFALRGVLRERDPADLARARAVADLFAEGLTGPEGLAVDGRDLLARGFRGPAVGRALNILFGAVLDGDVTNRRPDLLRFLDKKNPPPEREIP